MNTNRTLQYVISFSSTLPSSFIGLFLVNIGMKRDNSTFILLGVLYILLFLLHIMILPSGPLASLSDSLRVLFVKAPRFVFRVKSVPKDVEIVTSKFNVTYDNLSVVGIMRFRLTKQTIYKISLLLWSSAAYIILLSEYVRIQPSLVVIILAFVVIVLLYGYKFVVDFRIQNGFYGNNEREAREIIQFILDEAEDSDFTDNGKLKKIISDDDLYELEKSIESSWVPEYNKEQDANG